MLQGEFMWIEYLKQIFGADNISPLKEKKMDIPIYLMKYDFISISILDKEVLFVAPKEKLNLKSYNVQKNKIEKIFNCPVVLVVKGLRAYQRKILIEKQIMFVEEEGKQLFMPMFGVALMENSNEGQKKEITLFTPQTQLIALFFIYEQKPNIMVKDIMEKTQLNKMAISRGISVLIDMNVLTYEMIGNIKYYSRKISEAEFLEKIQPFMISPIYKQFTIKKINLPKQAIKAGYTALAEYSMIMDDELGTYAISKDVFKNIQDNVEIDYKNLTITVTGKTGRKDYLWEIGSGSNWLSYHISVSLAFQMFFAEQNYSTVPQFIVYDQPSQVYFPKKLAQKENEKEEDPQLEDEDILAVRKIFEAMSSALEKTNPHIQIIVLEHASESAWSEIKNINLVEEWRGDNNKLIPKEWLDEN